MDTIESQGIETENNKEVLETDQSPTPEIPEVDKFDKFRFAGQEWSPKDLTSAIMRQADYTRKTTELAKERDYYANLNADLENVMKNPALADEFRKVYPDKFHAYLKYVTKAETSATPETMNLPPEVSKRFEQLDKLEGYFRDQQVKAAEAELNSILDPLAKKYPFASEEAALARANALLSQGVELNQKNWEEIYSQLHKHYEDLAKKHFSAQVNKQKDANVRGSDVPQGGGTPSGAPFQPKSIKEAHKAIMERLNSQ